MQRELVLYFLRQNNKREIPPREIKHFWIRLDQIGKGLLESIS